MLKMEYDEKRPALSCFFSGSFRSESCAEAGTLLERRLAELADAKRNLPPARHIIFDLAETD